MADPRTFLFERIIHDVYVDAQKQRIFHPGSNTPEETGWLFDFRAITMNSDVLRACATLFYEHVRSHGTVQICGLEVAAVPLVTGIATHLARDGVAYNACFIRKGRKKSGLMRRVEGTILPGVPIVLIDDICNSGKSFEQQIAILEAEGHTVVSVWSILQFRDTAYYRYFAEKGITMHSVFTLNDFSTRLPVKNLTDHSATASAPHHAYAWRYNPGGANMSYILPKSRPCIDKTRLYYGTDSRTFVCLDQETGSVVWTYRVGSSAAGKSIFSSPVLSPDLRTVFFGAYDGNMYALDAATGKRVWVNFDADWIGSSPTLAPDLKMVFIGTEFGLIGKRGGINAIEYTTGKTIWSASMPSYTHATPYYIENYKQVVIGSNDGIVRLYDARNGALLWTTKTGDPTPHEIRSGFSPYDIKQSCTYDPRLDMVFVGNLEGTLCGIKRSTGDIMWKYTAEFAFWATPLVHTHTETVVYASSLDKHLYCINAQTGALLWKRHLGARIFCEPTMITIDENEVLVCGSNTGRLTAFEPTIGAELWHITLPERIVNAPVYNENTKQLFVPTAANEIYRFNLSR